MIEVLETRQLLADGITPAAGPPITAAPGVPITNAVFASFTVSDPTGAPGSKWRAEIQFGDGQIEKLAVPVQVGSRYKFQATHTYATAGSYTATVMIAVPGSHKPYDNVVTTPVTVTSTPTPQRPHPHRRPRLPQPSVTSDPPA